MDDRIERLRHADLADYFDRAIADVAPGTARRLVQVYNGGSMPNQPDHYYLTNPVYLSGDETEGGTADPTADTAQTLVVDVLGKAPAVGDILTAYAVGGRWVAELGGKGKGCIKFVGCNNSPLVGVIVNIYDKQGGTLLAGPLKSDANGNVCPGLPAGKYWVDTTETSSLPFPFDKYIWTAQNITIPAKNSVNWPTQILAGYGCCPTVNFPLPLTLYLTVCGQTITMVAATGEGSLIQGWTPPGGYIVPILAAGVAVVGGPFPCDLGGWDGMTTETATVPMAIVLFCPSDNKTMTGKAGVCGIAHWNGFIGTVDKYAIAPGQCVGTQGNALTCCAGIDVTPGPTVGFTLTGEIGDTVNLTGSMPGGMPPYCAFPPAQSWPMPCPGAGMTVTN